jgi:hypothetical protein
VQAAAPRHSHSIEASWVACGQPEMSSVAMSAQPSSHEIRCLTRLVDHDVLLSRAAWEWAAAQAGVSWPSGAIFDHGGHL